VPSGRCNDTLTYNAANMPLTRNGNRYTNDSNGNTLTGGGRTGVPHGKLGRAEPAPPVRV
jgi:hypothetical protein